MLRAVTLISFVVLCGCRTSPQPPLLMDNGESAAITTRYTPPRPPNLPPAPTGPAVRAPLPPRVTLSWPALSKAQAYRVDYGTALNQMTNSVMTSTTNCSILGSFIGQKYFYRVRGVNDNVYSRTISSGMFETK